MSTNVVLGRYILKDSIIHKLNPVFKILSLILIVVSIFFVGSYIDILMLGSHVLLTMLYSDIKIKEYLKNILSIKIILLLVVIINIIFFKSINNIIFSLCKLIFIIIYLSILIYTTAMTEIIYGIEKILRPIDRVIPVNKIAMIIALILRYIPTYTMEKNRIIKVETVKGIDFNDKNIKNKIKNKCSIIIPTIILSYRKTKDIVNTMNIRLYNNGKSRTNYRLNKWKYIDTTLLILNILILIIVIFY